MGSNVEGVGGGAGGGIPTGATGLTSTSVNFQGTYTPDIRWYDMIADAAIRNDPELADGYGKRPFEMQSQNPLQYNSTEKWAIIPNPPPVTFDPGDTLYNGGALTPGLILQRTVLSTGVVTGWFIPFSQLRAPTWGGLQCVVIAYT